MDARTADMLLEDIDTMPRARVIALVGYRDELAIGAALDELAHKIMKRIAGIADG